MPALNATFVADVDEKGTPGRGPPRARRAWAWRWTCQKSDGSRTLLVPCIKDADTLDFRAFVLAYEDLVRKVHTEQGRPRRLRRHHGDA